MNCFGFDDSVDVQGTTQTFCILVEIERIEVKGLLWAGSETVRRHPQTERQHQLWMKLGISECPSGDFMSRMNRLSGGPS